MRTLNLFKFILSLFTMSSLLSCTLKDKISTLNPQAVVSTSSLSLKVQNAESTNTSQVELDEGTLILATAILDKAKKKDIKLTVKITSSAGDARVLERFSSYTNTVTIPAGLTSGFISIQTIDDVSVQDGDEEFTLSIFPEDEDEFKNASSFVTLVIKDNEDMPTVSFQSATQNKNEDDVSGQVNLELSQVSGQTVSVRVSAVDETAQAGTDYTYSSQVISFAPGEVSKPVSFNLTNRSGIQASRTFKFQLSDVNNGLITTNTTSINTNEHTVTIIDVDQAGLSISDVSVNEGSNAVFTVSLSSAYTSDVSVDYSVTALTAVAGTDYTAATGSVTIPTGSTTANITIATLTNADVCAANKTFKVVLTNAVNASIGDSEGVGTIIDITNPTVSLASSTSSVTEGSNTSLSVNLSAVCATRNVTVEYSTTAGTATATTDFTTATAATLTITAGDSSGVIAIPTANDTLDEDDETFTVTLSSPTNATLGATTTSTVTITDNDAAPSVTLAASANTISEGGTTVTLTATLSAVSAKSVSLPFTITGTATATSDYTISSSPLTIVAGATTATITLTMVEDTDLEGDETVIVTLDTPTNASLGATTTQTITITDNDLGTFSISGITGENESTDDANLSNGLNPKINWGLSSGATGYKVSIVSDDQATTVCAEQTLGNVSTYQYSSGDCTLTVATYYRARVSATFGAIEQAGSNTNFRFYVNTSPSLASNGEGPWYVMAGSSITINAVGGSSPTIGVASDADGDAFEFTALGAGSLGTVTTGTSSFTFAATSGVTNHGRAGVTYTITDARGGTRSGTIYIHIMQATSWTGNTSNTWNTNSNWCGAISAGNRSCTNGGTAPVSGAARAYIDDTCTQNCSPATHGSFTVGGLYIKGSTLNIQSGHTLTVSTDGLVQSGGTLNLSGTLAMTNASLVAPTGSWVLASGSTLSLSVSSTVSKTLTLPVGTILQNFTISGNCSAQATCSYSFTNNVVVQGILTLAATNTGSAIFDQLITSSSVIEARGDIYLNTAGLSSGKIIINGSTNQTVTGAATAFAPSIEIASTGGTVTLTGTMKIASGAFIHTSGLVLASASTIEFQVLSSWGSDTINASTIEFDNITISGNSAGVSSQYTILSSLTAKGTLTFNGSGGNTSDNQLFLGTIYAYGDINFINYGAIGGSIVTKGINKTITGAATSHLPDIVFDHGLGNQITLAGTLTCDSCTMTRLSGDIDAGTSTVVFNVYSAGAKSLDVSEINFNNVTFKGNSAGTSRYFSIVEHLNVLGTLTFSGSGGNATDNSLYSGVINTWGDVIYADKGVVTGSVNFKGASQTLSGVSTAKVNTLTFENGAGSTTLSGTLVVYSQSWTYVSGTIDGRSSSVEFQVSTTGARNLTVAGISFGNVTFSGNSGGVTRYYNITDSLNVFGTLTFAGSGSAAPDVQLVYGTINAYSNIAFSNYGVYSNPTINWVDEATSTTATITSAGTSNWPRTTINVNRQYASVRQDSNITLSSAYAGTPNLNITSGTWDMNGFNLTAPKGITNSGTIQQQGSGASCGTITGTVTGNAPTCP